MAIASLILGILAIVTSFIFPYISPILGIVGIILGVIGRKNCAAANQPTGMATAGLVMSIIGTVLGLLLLIACTLCIGGGLSALSGLK